MGTESIDRRDHILGHFWHKQGVSQAQQLSREEEEGSQGPTWGSGHRPGPGSVIHPHTPIDPQMADGRAPPLGTAVGRSNIGTAVGPQRWCGSIACSDRRRMPMPVPMHAGVPVPVCRYVRSPVSNLLCFVGALAAQHRVKASSFWRCCCCWLLLLAVSLYHVHVTTCQKNGRRFGGCPPACQQYGMTPTLHTATRADV